MEQTKQLMAASALRKAVSVLMALVLAVGLCPTPKQAWAATGDPHTITINVDEDGYAGTLEIYDYNTDKVVDDLTAVGESESYAVKPASNDYEITSLTITKTGDSSVEVTSHDDNYGSYYQVFTMESYDVTINVTFKYNGSTTSTSHLITTNGEWEEDYEDYATDGGYYTIKKKPGGLGGGETAGGVADEGDTIVVAPTAEDDDAVVTVKYTFDGIDTVVQNNYGYYFTMPAGDIHITVTFESPSSGDTDSNYALSFTMDSPSNANEVVTDKTAQATINSITATVNGKVPETEEAAGTLAFQVIGSLDGEEKALSKSVPATWEYYKSSFYRYKKPDAITYSAPEKAGNWSVVLRATWTVNNEVVKTADSPFSWTMTVADEPADEGEFNLIIEDAENGSVTADVAKFDAGDTINLTITPATGYELDAIEPLAKQNDKFVDASYEAKVVVSDDLATATVSVDPYWEDSYYSDLKLVPTFKAAATKYSVTAATVTGGEIQIGKASVAEDEIASFTLVPDAGYAYKANTAKVLKAEGNAETGVSIIGPYSNNGSFTMPGYDVIVTAEFEETTYPVNIIPSENGAVSADVASAKIGDTVTLTVTPSETYYELDNLSVTAYTSGNADPTVTTVEEGKTYTFQMVNGGATVAATFKDTRAEQEITASDLTVKYGTKTEFEPVAKGELTYTSSSEDVATVEDGKVVARGVGETTITINAAGTNAYQPATKTITVTVEEADNGLVATAAVEQPSVAYSTANQVIAAEKLYSVSGADGDVVYVKKSGSSVLKVNPATGAITVPSSTVPGAYSANVIVLAAGDATHAANYAIVPVEVTVTKAAIDNLAVTPAWKSKAFSNGVQKPGVSKVGSFTFADFKDNFDVTYSNANSKNAGDYTVTVTAKANSKLFTGTSKAATYKITAATNPVKVTSKAAAKKKPVSIKANKSGVGATVTGAQGKVTLDNKSSNRVAKTFTLSYSSGKVNVKVPKGTKKGIYEVKIAVTANSDSKNKNYTKVTTKPVSCWVKVG